MRRYLEIFFFLALLPFFTSAKIFEKCELAKLLSHYGMSNKEVPNWVCIAEFESTFNTEAINEINYDGSWDYGLFQLNDKYWCDDRFKGKNVCKMNCTDLLDENLIDDLKCIQKIIKDTERWKGKGTGLTAWVAYVNSCQGRDLKEYMSECRRSSIPSIPSIIDNIIPRDPSQVVPDTSPQKPQVGEGDEIPIPGCDCSKPTKIPPRSDVVIPSSRIPLPPSHFLLTLSPGALTYAAVPSSPTEGQGAFVPSPTGAQAVLYNRGDPQEAKKRLKVTKLGGQHGPSLTVFE